MCYCQNGNAKCDTTTCPKLNCTEGTLRRSAGECCPVCSTSRAGQESNLSIPRGCTFGGNFYSAGSKFHPFLMPNGFDLCTECDCDPIKLEVKCTRVGDEKTCCSKCSDRHTADSENGTYVRDNESPSYVVVPPRVTPKPKPSKQTAEHILNNGGCINVYDTSDPHKNGAKFHPYIDSLGEYKCVTCKCEVS